MKFSFGIFEKSNDLRFRYFRKILIVIFMIGDTTFGAYESLTRLAVGRDVLNWMSVTEYPKRSTINSLLENFYEDFLKFELMVV